MKTMHFMVLFRHGGFFNTEAHPFPILPLWSTYSKETYALETPMHSQDLNYPLNSKNMKNSKIYNNPKQVQCKRGQRAHWFYEITGADKC